MLIQFLVENFLSFKDETVFSLLAPPEETRGVVEIPAHGLRLMRIAAFYGANASGKSNLVNALATARRLITREQPSEYDLPAKFFQLDAEMISKPSRFQFDFIINDTKYTYILVFAQHAIQAEALHRKLPNIERDEIVFEREAIAEAAEHKITLGPLFDERSEEDRQFARFTARGAHVRQPLLAKFVSGNVSGFGPIYGWFKQDLTVIGVSAAYANLVRELREDATFRAFYSTMLNRMGTGIDEVIVEKTIDPELDQFLERVDNLRKLPDAREVFDSISMQPTGMDGGIEIDRRNGAATIWALRLMHSTRTGNRYKFNLYDESDGTRRLLHLLPVLFHHTHHAEEPGLCTVIDELDRSLHTTLTRHFVNEFLNLGSGTQTQLIFTTHDTNLLNRQLLPIPAIWFVEKDEDGASHIYSLAEYKPDQIAQLLEHLEEGYLQGRFGAIPFIADRTNLRWQIPEEKPAQ